MTSKRITSRLRFAKPFTARQPMLDLEPDPVSKREITPLFHEEKGDKGLCRFLVLSIKKEEDQTSKAVK